MNSHTREYVQRRFGEYYDEVTLSEPPNVEQREWGLTDWTNGDSADDDTYSTFRRHLSIFELGDLTERVRADPPLHLYMSTAEYETPTSTDIDTKNWLGADITFFIEIDNLDDPPADTSPADDDSSSEDQTDTDPTDDTPSEADEPPAPPTREQFEACKSELQILLRRLDALHIETTNVFFTGEGFRVQIQDDDYRQLRESERAELLDYVTASEFDAEIFDPPQTPETTIADMLAQYTGGWRHDLHAELVDHAHELTDLDSSERTERIEQFDQIGPKTSKQVDNQLTSRIEIFESGRGDEFNPEVKQWLGKKMDDFIEPHRAAITSTETTNPHAFVRLPDTLNGNTGLKVMPVDPDEIEQFDPTIDPIPEPFQNTDVTVDVVSPGTYHFGGDEYTLDEGEQTLPEPLGVFLMLQNCAEKVAE